MGCWNETCMISNLPILAGEECAIAILMDRGIPNEGVYPTDQYMPFAIIHGEYDEYGRLENANEEEVAALLSALPALSLKGMEDGNYVDYTVSNLENFLDEIQAEEGLFVPFNKKGRMLPIRYVFLKTRMLALATPDEFRQPILDEAFSGGVQEAMQGIREVLSYHPMSNQLLYPFHKALISVNKDVAYRNISQIVSLYRLLCILRKSWHIPAGKGSQNLIFDETLAFGKAYVEEIESIQKEVEC